LGKKKLKRDEIEDAIAGGEELDHYSDVEIDSEEVNSDSEADQRNTPPLSLQKRIASSDDD